MILVIDNYDSFTYNLVHLLLQAGVVVVTRRNDEVSVEDVRRMAPSGIVLSPGPGRPSEAGITREVVRVLGSEVPMLGVCLGHQAIGEVFGASVVRAPVPVHGKTSRIRHDARTLFEGLPQGFAVTRYHSLVLEPTTLPPTLEAAAWADDGTLMAIRHRHLPLQGVQFHPECILSEHGSAIVRAWLTVAEPHASPATA